MAGNVCVPYWLLEQCQLLSSRRSVLTRLDLSGHYELGDGLTLTLSIFLRDNNTLRELYLTNCGICDHGATALFRTLASSTCLEKLRLDSNYCGNESMTMLSRTLGRNDTLIELDLEDNELADDGADSLAKGVHQNTCLQILNLGRNQIGEKGVEMLGLVLAKTTTLQELLLHDNRIGEKGTEHLARGVSKNQQQSLKVLSLANNQIEDVGATHLGTMLAVTTQSLQELYIYDNDIGPLGGIQLANGIQKNGSLSLLQLEGNQIGSEGAQAFGSTLKSNKQKLATLVLARNNISSQGAVGIAKGIQHNAGSLKVLNLSMNSIDGAGAKALGEAIGSQTGQRLRVLHLQDNQINDEGCVALALGVQKNAGSLEVLNLGENEIGNAGAVAFQSAISTENQNLCELYLCHNRIGAQGGNAIFEGLQRNNGSLRFLSLCYNHFGPGVAKALSLALHSSSQELVQLKLRGNKFGEEGVIQLVKSMTRCAGSLEVLDIGDNDIGDGGVEPLCLFLGSAASSKLKEVYLDSNGIGNKGVAALLGAHQQHHDGSPVFLDLGHNHLGDDGVKELVKVFKMRLKLQRLDLTDCVKCQEGMRRLVREGLQENYFLEELTLGEMDNDALQEELDLYLRLNASGRRRLLRSTLLSSLLPFVLAKVQNDPSVMFYYLRQNPGMFGNPSSKRGDR